MKPYYYVYRETTLDGRPPTQRHATLELAQAEAERLAVKHTGSVIQILKCVGISQVTGPASTFFMDGEGPVHPLEAREPTFNCPTGGNARKNKCTCGQPSYAWPGAVFTDSSLPNVV